MCVRAGARGTWSSHTTTGTAPYGHLQHPQVEITRARDPRCSSALTAAFPWPCWPACWVGAWVIVGGTLRAMRFFCSGRKQVFHDKTRGSWRVCGVLWAEDRGRYTSRRTDSSGSGDVGSVRQGIHQASHVLLRLCWVVLAHAIRTLKSYWRSRLPPRLQDRTRVLIGEHGPV